MKDKNREQERCAWYYAVVQIVRDAGIDRSSKTQLECLLCPEGRPTVGECKRYYDTTKLNGYDS